MGARPASMAEAASERSRPGCDQLISSCAAVTGPTPGWASSAGASTCTAVRAGLRLSKPGAPAQPGAQRLRGGDQQRLELPAGVRAHLDRPGAGKLQHS